MLVQSDYGKGGDLKTVAAAFFCDRKCLRGDASRRMLYRLRLISFPISFLPTLTDPLKVS
jgi:hypothetical protein